MLNQPVLKPTELRHFWIEGARRGDRSAQQAIYNTYAKAMYNISLRLVNNRQDAEDVLHDAFVAAFGKLGQLEDDRQFAGWLKRIVINTSLQLIRRRPNWKAIDDEPEPALGNRTDDWIRSIPPTAVQQAILELPEGCRQVFVLYLMEGMKHQEIADALDISLSTSKSQYIRAKHLLKERLTENLTL